EAFPARTQRRHTCWFAPSPGGKKRAAGCELRGGRQADPSQRRGGSRQSQSAVSHSARGAPHIGISLVTSQARNTLMMAPGFKPVGWVAAVAASAIGCYMLSLNVASERADLLRVEQQIVATKQDIRTLQTELGTRGRMAQLEQWNTDVLALAAPSNGQVFDNEEKLARSVQRAPTLEEKGEVRMASAPVAAEPAGEIEAPVVLA